MNSKTIKYLFVFILSISFLCGCSLLKKKAKFDPEGLEFANRIKVKALQVMRQAEASFFYHKDDVHLLMTEVEKAYEYARTQKNNDAIKDSWNLMRDPAKERLGGFMVLWEREDKLDGTTIALYVQWVEADLNTIIELENAKKPKPK